MNEEQIKSLAVKYEVEETLVKNVINSETKDLESRGLTQKEIDKYLPRRIEQAVRQKKSFPTDTITGYIIGMQRLSDFAEINRNSTTKKMIERTDELKSLNFSEPEIKKTLLKEQYFDTSDNLLYFSGFNKGKNIPEHDFSRNVIVWGAKEGEKSDIYYLELKGEKALAKVPINQEAVFECMTAKDQSGTAKKGFMGLSMLRGVSSTKFELTGKHLEPEALEEFLVGNYQTLLSDIKQMHTMEAVDYNAFYALKADIVSGSLYMDSAKVNIVKVNDNSCVDLDIAGFMDKELEVDFEDGAMECIILAKPNKVKEKKKPEDPDINLNIIGVIAPKAFRPTGESAPVEGMKEVTEPEETLTESPKEAPADNFDEGSDDEEGF